MIIMYRGLTRTLMNQSIYEDLSEYIHKWGQSLGFQQVGISDIDLELHEQYLHDWLKQDFNGDMQYMSAHGLKRSRPGELVTDTKRIITVRMNYLPADTSPHEALQNNNAAYVSRYALGRDYHKVIRRRLLKLWKHIQDYLAEYDLKNYRGRVFTDSAPVLEKALAEKAGLGWIGKNTMLLNREAGSWFFLGEIYTDIPLIVDNNSGINHCGSCSACIDICPTKAIIAPYQLDARLCISYLTIELRGIIPTHLRESIGNRIFGCDDCQLFCPWNKFSQFTNEPDFNPRHRLDSAALLELFSWTEVEFLSNTEGSAIRRTGYEGWQRNIAIALGNANYNERITHELNERNRVASSMLIEHIDWALKKQTEKQADQEVSLKNNSR